MPGMVAIEEGPPLRSQEVKEHHLEGTRRRGQRFPEQFAVEAQPIGVEITPHSRGLRGDAKLPEQRLLGCRRKEPSASTGMDHAQGISAEPSPGGCPVAAEDHHHTHAGVFLLAHHPPQPLRGVMGKSPQRVL